MGVRIDCVVAAIDFGEPSVAAAQWAARYFAPDTEFVLVHVLDAVEPPWWSRTRAPPGKRVLELAREAADRRLRELIPALGAPLAFTEVAVGDPAERIGQLAADFQADVVVAGPHGGRPAPWNLLGSTAERLVRSAGKPVLVVREPRPRAPRNVLVPLEGLELPVPVSRWLAHLHARGDVVSTALTVVPAASPEPRRASRIVRRPPQPSRPVTQLRQQLDRSLDGARRELGFDARTLGSQVVFGKPAEEIVAAARRSSADLIVMASRAAGALSRTVLGSVTGSVLRGAPCPVLVLRRETGRTRRRRAKGRAR